jgi:hypothetical protein
MDPVSTAIIGGLAGGVAKAVVDNASAAISKYLQQVNEGRDRLTADIADAMQEIPPERIAEPQPHVVEPIYRGLVLRTEDDLLRSMFKRLLRQAFDRELQQDLHPAFTKLLNEISPDEALLLYIAKRMEAFKFPSENPADDERGIRPFPVDDLSHPEDFGEYIDHLVSLGLVEVCGPPAEVKVQAGSAISAMVTGGLGGGFGSRQIPLTGLQQLAMPGKPMALSRFGTKFARACIPDTLPQHSASEQMEMVVDQ